MNVFLTLLKDFTVTLLLFFFCLFTVLGIKLCVLFIKSKFVKNTVKIIRKPKRKIKSIEINPDEIDRIYVKKN